MYRTAKFLLALLLIAAVLFSAAYAEPAQTTLEFDFLSKLLILDAETLSTLTAPADAEEASQSLSTWLAETVGEISSPELLDELLRSRLPLSLLDGVESLCVREIYTETLNPDTAGSGRYKFTVLADAMLDRGEASELTFFGRLTKDEAAGQITALRLNRMP